MVRPLQPKERERERKKKKKKKSVISLWQQSKNVSEGTVSEKGAPVIILNDWRQPKLDISSLS